MKIYKTSDHTSSSIHYAKDKEDAIRKHLIHYSLIVPCEIRVEELKEVDESLICLDFYCNGERE